MNRTCQGHKFNANKKSYYRCFYNGKICSPAPKQGEKCQVCGREIDGELSYVSHVLIDLGTIGTAYIKLGDLDDRQIAQLIP